MRTADGSGPRLAGAAVGLIVLAGVVSYANSLDGEFVFDDLDSVVGNASVRSLGSAWNPPPNTTTSGRPLLNVTLALNYAAGGYDVRGYHVVNVAVHLLAAVTLFALVRGTLLRPAVPEHFRRRATAVALAVGLLWAVHPLQTEVVAYVVQRGEALAALFVFAALLCLLQSAEWGERAARWAAAAARGRPALHRRHVAARERANRFAAAAVGAAVLGVLSKETAAATPVIALFYDRAFLSGSFGAALRRRRWTYTGLFASWVVLAWLIGSTAGRGGTAGAPASPLAYAAAQSMWILHYLRLSAWPDPLVFDYGFAVEPWGPTTRATAGAVLVLLGLAAAACARWPMLGFLPAAFFAALAPSSSFVPVITQVAAERRMYLPLAAVVTLAVLGVVRLALAVPAAPEARRRVLIGLLAACALVFAVLTHLRNRDYRTGERLWADTVAKVPDNPRARTNLGLALLEHGRVEAAVKQLRAAAALAPDDPRPRNALGFALLRQERFGEAVASFREVARLDPDNPDAQENLAGALHADGQLDEAVVWYRKVVAARPENADAHFGLGQALRAAGRKEEAAGALRRAAELDPKYAAWRTAPSGP
jgi:Tfp pilus assembly protein PilF